MNENGIKPIETRYKGYRFRSRLEARWAVFFDSLGIEWQYEPEGFENAEGDKYLPDFYLPRTDTWVEIKGYITALCTKDASEKMKRLLDYGGVLPKFSNSLGTTAGLLLLSNIPDGTFSGYPFRNGTCYPHYCHPIIQHHKGLWKSWVVFRSKHPHGLLVEGMEPLDASFHPLGSELLRTMHKYTYAEIIGDADDWSCETRVVYASGAYDGVMDAYVAARSARFEHGECG